MTGEMLLLDDWIEVCTVERLADRNMVCVRAGGMEMIVLRDGEVIHVCERACPHEQADLSLGTVGEGKVFCPRHLAWFSLSTGAVSPGWSSRALLRFPVRISDGRIFIRPSPLSSETDKPD